jgi:hypothetical protein
MNEYSNKNNSSPDVLTPIAAQLSVIEIALGTIVHAAHLPFGGHLLSLNEGAFLCRASNLSEDRFKAAAACYEISGVAASMKSLAPAAKKLGPMLSIVMQGLLFALGLLIGGRKRTGQILGFIFLSAWAFVQPFVTLLITFGPTELEKTLHFYLTRLDGEYALWGHAVLTVIVALYLAKCFVGAGLSFSIAKLTQHKWDTIQAQIQERARSVTISNFSNQKYKLNPWQGALRDLTQPLFLFSLVLTLLFLFIQKESWSTFIWLALRPIAVAFIIFYLLRANWFLKVCSFAAQRLGLLRPIERRLTQVQHYLNAMASKP